MKMISANITPQSNIKALLNPFVALVSRSTKKTGPIVNASIIPKGIAAKTSSNITYFKVYYKVKKYFKTIGFATARIPLMGRNKKARYFYHAFFKFELVFYMLSIPLLILSLKTHLLY